MIWSKKLVIGQIRALNSMGNWKFYVKISKNLFEFFFPFFLIMSANKREVTAIKGDAEQTAQGSKIKVDKLEGKCAEYKEQIKHTPEIYEQMHKELSQAIEKNENSYQFIKGRLHYLQHAVLANRNDQNIFKSKLVDIHNKGMKEKADFDQQIAELRFQQQEMENGYQTKIKAVMYQLQGLREFQFRRHILEDQIKDLKRLISQESKAHHEEITEIHHLLLNQREYYENDLRTRLTDAQNYARTYADLHIDLLTQKIYDETYEHRSNLNSLNKKDIDNLYGMDDLKEKLNVIRKQNKILRLNVEKSTLELLDLKRTKKELVQEMNDKLEMHKNMLEDYKEELSDKIAELSVHVPIIRDKNQLLKQEHAELLKTVQQLEESRLDIGKDDADLLNKVNENSELLFNKLEEKYGESDDPILVSHKTPIGKLIRKLSLVVEENKLLSNCSPISLSPDNDIIKMPREVQTEKPIRSKRLNGIKAPPTPPNPPVPPYLTTPPSSPRTMSPRTTTPRKNQIRRSEYYSPTDYLGLSKTGRMPSTFIRIIRSPRK
ncbi:hypothetical protein TRFO_05579 [Tritrichomonas foetus]|uniref:Cilia- and flagella-associated protein 157 n=1 Tax=Tritrichomonas foetus TaxID=1144522 RepID=A0A1J4K9R4_9EUKA|nr:hypothetical protein TRFO_05579 [Tritrichomonas foetus]|eukprot:OHT06382.1 hypothetical protein TRFO_05579 [Tritrichomonas foetus]